MKTTRILVVALVAAAVLGFGCKSDDEAMAGFLENEAWQAVAAAQASGDRQRLERVCLAAWMAMEAPEVKRLVKIGGLTTDMKKKIAKACEGLPSVEDLVKAELERELEKAQAESPTDDGH